MADRKEWLQGGPIPPPSTIIINSKKTSDMKMKINKARIEIIPLVGSLIFDSTGHNIATIVKDSRNEGKWRYYCGVYGSGDNMTLEDAIEAVKSVITANLTNYWGISVEFASDAKTKKYYYCSDLGMVHEIELDKLELFTVTCEDKFKLFNTAAEAVEYYNNVGEYHEK